MKAIKRKQNMDRKIVERLRAGDGINETARNLCVSKRRVIALRALAKERGYLDESASLPAYPEVLFPDIVDGRSARGAPTDQELVVHQAWIKERLEAGWYPVTVWEELPVRVPRANFYRFLKRHKLKELGERARRVIPEIISAPGESLQLDWAKLRSVYEDGKRRTLWMLIGVLGHSRYLMVRLVWKYDVETTLHAIRSMLEELGGVPRKITTDNPKCISILASRYEAVLNPVAERFASHYGFIFECLPPRSPQQKGKVERQVPYARRLYQAHGDNWWGLEESENYFNKKLLLANGRKHGTTGLKPQLELEEERKVLRPLPATPYEIEEYHSGTVRADGCVRFRGKYYSVERQYAREEVVVLGNSSKISIYHKGKLIEVHDRVSSPHQSKSIKPQHKEIWERTFEEQSLYRERARALGGWVEELIITILAQGDGFIDFRKIWGILSLDKKFSAAVIDQACKVALEQERWSYWAVHDNAEALTAALREQNQEPDKQLKIVSAKFTHDISRYSSHVQVTLINGGQNE